MDLDARASASRADSAVEGNARLTAANAAVLLVVLAAEGFTLLGVRQMLTPHVFIGMVLIPPVLLKAGGTSWRFARYYGGATAYRRTGPPPVLHLADMVRLALRDCLHRTRRDVRGAGISQWLIAASLAIGAVTGVLVLSRIGPWLTVSGQ